MSDTAAQQEQQQVAALKAALEAVGTCVNGRCLVSVNRGSEAPNSCKYLISLEDWLARVSVPAGIKVEQVREVLTELVSAEYIAAATRPYPPGVVVPKVQHSSGGRALLVTGRIAPYLPCATTEEGRSRSHAATAILRMSVGRVNLVVDKYPGLQEMLDFVILGLSGENPALGYRFLHWMSQMVQFPDEPTNLIPVFTSKPSGPVAAFWRWFAYSVLGDEAASVITEAPDFLRPDRRYEVGKLLTVVQMPLLTADALLPGLTLHRYATGTTTQTVEWGSLVKIRPNYVVISGNQSVCGAADNSVSARTYTLPSAVVNCPEMPKCDPAIFLKYLLVYDVNCVVERVIPKLRYIRGIVPWMAYLLGTGYNANGATVTTLHGNYTHWLGVDRRGNEANLSKFAAQLKHFGVRLEAPATTSRRCKVVATAVMEVRLSTEVMTHIVRMGALVAFPAELTAALD